MESLFGHGALQMLCYFSGCAERELLALLCKLKVYSYQTTGKFGGVFWSFPP